MAKMFKFLKGKIVYRGIGTMLYFIKNSDLEEAE